MSVASVDKRVLARATRSLIKGVGAQFADRRRGPDSGEGRRVPRRRSYEENDPRARPWSRIGDGSKAQGLMHCEALLQTAKELRRQQWQELPNAVVRDARREHAAHEAELEQLMAMKDAPPGRAAKLRMELARLGEILRRAALRLQRVDITVLEAMLRKLNFATGELYPCIDTLAADAVCHRNSVNVAKDRLKANGLVDWVRRTVRTGAEGEFGPQLEQTSNAYFFDHQAQMAPRTWQRYRQILIAKLKRIGAAAAQALASLPAPAREVPRVKDPALAAALRRIGASVDNAST